MDVYKVYFEGLCDFIFWGGNMIWVQETDNSRKFYLKVKAFFHITRGPFW